MSNTATATQSADNAIERAEVTRTLNLVKHEVALLFQDSTRKRPFYAASQKEAAAKLASAVKVLNEFAASLDAIKKK